MDKGKTPYRGSSRHSSKAGSKASNRRSFFFYTLFSRQIHTKGNIKKKIHTKGKGREAEY